MLMHRPKLPPPPGRPPTRVELLDFLEQHLQRLTSMAGRWQGGIPAEVRAEIITEAYEPVLKTLILARRLPIPR
jgi:hypothetical protein